MSNIPVFASCSRRFGLQGLVISSLVLAAPASIVRAATYTVLPDGTGDFPTIQAAVDAASAGDVIELGDGTFMGSGNRDVDTGGKAVTIRSTSNNPALCIIDCGGSAGDHHRGFLFVSGEGSDTILEGITIQSGYTTDLGGGIFCDASSPTFRNLTLSQNYANQGAGIYSQDGTLTMTDCSFLDNTADAGGGYGGAVKSTSYLEISDSYFHSNVAVFNSKFGGGSGGGISAGAGIVSDCVFEENGSGTSGGAITASVEILRCQFLGNTSRIWGGAVSGGSSVSDCVFIGNHVTYEGGALRASTVPVTRCLFVDNTGRQGGALYTRGDTEVSSCTFYGNGSELDTGGGVYVRSGTAPTFDHTIISHSAQGEAVYCQDGTSAPTLTCCDLYANAGGDWIGCIAGQLGADGNFSGDPLYCDPVGDDFTLDAFSPCLDAPGCGLVGVYGQGCGEATSAELTTWGALKVRTR